MKESKTDPVEGLIDHLMERVGAAIEAEQVARVPVDRVAPGVDQQDNDEIRLALEGMIAAFDVSNYGDASMVATTRECALSIAKRAVGWTFASPAPKEEEAARLSGFDSAERLGHQEEPMTKNYDDYRAGILRAAEMARNEFKRAPDAAKGHDCVYMSGYEDACDHLSIVIAQAAVIDSVRIAGSQPDWQYHISLLLPDGIADETLLKIYQVVEHELRAATASAPAVSDCDPDT